MSNARASSGVFSALSAAFKRITSSCAESKDFSASAAESRTSSNESIAFFAPSNCDNDFSSSSARSFALFNDLVASSTGGDSLFFACRIRLTIFEATGTPY